MPTTADAIAATVAGIRSKVPGIAFPDSYELLVVTPGTPASDTRGNRTAAATPTVVETGRCLLKAGGLQPQERAIADKVRAIAPYAMLLPYATVAAATHQVRVNTTRTFEVAGVLKTAGFGALATAVCQEITG